MKKYIILTLLLFWLTPVRIEADVVKSREDIVICGTLKGKEINSSSVTHDSIQVILTGYCNDYRCTQSGKGITASGTRASRGTIASPAGINFGTKVHVNGSIRTVEDRGGAISVVNGVYHFDLWFPSYSEAKTFGVKKGRAYWIDNELYIDIT